MLTIDHKCTRLQSLLTLTLSFSFRPAAASSVMPDEVRNFVGDVGWLQEMPEACYRWHKFALINIYSICSIESFL